MASSDGKERGRGHRPSLVCDWSASDTHWSGPDTYWSAPTQAPDERGSAWRCAGVLGDVRGRLAMCGSGLRVCGSGLRVCGSDLPNLRERPPQPAERRHALPSPLGQDRSRRHCSALPVTTLSLCLGALRAPYVAADIARGRLTTRAATRRARCARIARPRRRTHWSCMR